MDKYLSTYAKMKFIKEMTDEEYKKNDNSYEINFVKQFDDLEENDQKEIKDIEDEIN